MTAPPDWQPTGNWQSTGNWSAAGGPALPVLARSVLFADWPPEAIALVARRFRHRPVQAGDVICRQGDSGDEMYVIEHGQFAVDAMIGGRSVRFAELGPGGVFGEIAVLSRRPRSATVTALVPGTIWSLQRADFVDLASQYQGFGAAAGRLASERLAEQSRIADRGAGPSTAWPPAAQPDPETGPARVLEPGYEPGNAPAPRTAPNTISEASARSVAWGDTGTHTIAGGLSAIDLSRLANEPQSVLSLQPKQEAVTIGRDEHNDLVLHDPRVSRRHALVRRAGATFRIEDLGSTNGVFVNGQRVDRVDLTPGDQIQIGGQVLRFDPAELTQYTRGRGAQVDAVGLGKVVGKGLTILTQVSLSVYPGELVAIVGGSGAGKTTLLNALSGVGPPSSGRVLYDGDDYYQHFQAYKQVLGYVPQDDIVHPELTVYRTLYYAARLRLPTDTSRQEIETRIEQVMAQLELTPRRNTEVHKLSGGQRKRVSIGVELLTEPEVFYLDEPTSGLDPGLDLRMMELLRGIADQGRTVILTTHATRNVMLCDKVAFMARGGHLAYYGPPAEALQYFGVTDFVEIYRLLDAEGAAEQAAARYLRSRPYEQHVAQRLDRRALDASGQSPPSTRAGGRSARGGPGWLMQLFWLTLRYLTVLRGDRVALGMLLIAAPLIGLVMGSTFDKHPFSRSIEDGDISQAISLIYVLSATAIFLGSFVAARSIAEESAIYARERLVNLSLVPYVFSKVVALGLFGAFQSAALVLVIALRLDIPGGGRMLLDWFGVVLLTSIVSLGMGLAVSAMSTNTLRAMLLHSLVINPQLVLSGALVPLKQLDKGSQAIADMTIGRWTVSFLGYLNDVNGIFEDQFGPSITNDYASQFDLEPTHVIAVYAGMFLVFLIITIVALKRRDAR